MGVGYQHTATCGGRKKIRTMYVKDGEVRKEIECLSMQSATELGTRFGNWIWRT